LVCSNNVGKAIVIDATAGVSSFYGIQAEANNTGGAGPVIDLGANNQQLFGVLIGYNSTSDIGIKFNVVTGCLVHGLITNSAAAQTDIQFAAGNTHSNEVWWHGGGDAAVTGHISDLSGNPGNYVHVGGRLLNDVAVG